MRGATLLTLSPSHPLTRSPRRAYSHGAQPVALRKMVAKYWLEQIPNEKLEAF
jgi:hypothetical protein